MLILGAYVLEDPHQNFLIIRCGILVLGPFGLSMLFRFQFLKINLLASNLLLPSCTMSVIHPSIRPSIHR